MPMTRGMGFIPDRLADIEEDSILRPLFGRGAGESELAGVTSSYAASKDWRHLVDYVPSQGITNRCVGWYASSALYLAGLAQNNPIKRPSAKWLYDVARYLSTPAKLIDVGCRPRDLMVASQEHGIVAEDDCPTTVANVNDPPDFGVDIAAASARLDAFYLIWDPDSSAEQIRAALDKGHFPGIGIEVHESFSDYRGIDIYDEPSGDFRGLHMLTCVGYRPGAICVLNSWSKSWGDDGYGWLSDRFIRSHYTKHRMVCTAAPASLAA